MEHRTLIKCLKNELSMEEWRDTFELGDKLLSSQKVRRGIANTWNRKRVSQYSKEGKLLNTFESISEACEKSGINNIQACCNGGRVKSAGGFILEVCRRLRNWRFN